MNYHEPGVIPFLGRMLCNEMFRKMIVIGTQDKVFWHYNPGV
jgi:hypothetical protein